MCIAELSSKANVNQKGGNGYAVVALNYRFYWS